MRKRLTAILCVLFLLAGCSHTPVSVSNTAPVSPLSPESPPASSVPSVPVPDGPADKGTYLSTTDAYSGMDDPEFWSALCADADGVRMTDKEILAFNASVLADFSTLCVDLRSYPDSLNRTDLTSAVKTYGQVPSASYFTKDGSLTGEQQNAITENLNLGAVQDLNPVMPGFVVRRAPLKTWPTSEELYESADDIEYDLARESTLLTWEPVCVLHTSADGAYLLVQAYNYIGWVSSDDIALTDRATWTAYQDADFLMVRASRLALGDSVYTPLLNGTVLTMGVHLPLSDSALVDNASTENAYTVLLPLRSETGMLETAEARIPMSADVCKGYPVLTDRELLKQVFRLLGERYGWGGMFGGWDCSSICSDAYAVFGVKLPRNSSRQVLTGVTYDLQQKEPAEKLSLLSTLRPGALLEIKGHMMFWLGMFDGRGYVLHSTYGFQPEDQPFTVTNCVTVSSVEVMRSGGGTILQNIRRAAEVKNP